MGRSVYADESISAYIEDLIKRRQWYIGIILGQVSVQKDFVLHLARTPEASEDDVHDESEIGQVEELPSISKKKPKTQPKSLEKADEQWLATHAKQVTKMLPGGLDVIGIFAVAPTPMLKEAQAKLRQLIYAVHKSVTKNVPVLSPAAVTERIILQVDALTSKIVCSSVDVSNSKSTLRPAEWRYSSVTKWLRLESAVAVEVSLPVTNVTRQQTLLKDMQQAVSPFCHQLWQSVALVGGEVRDNSELLATFHEGKKGKSKDLTTSHQDTYQVDFLMRMQRTPDVEDPKVTEVNKIVCVRGIIVSRAFVQWKATVKEAVEAVKSDVVRSLCSRCELLSEDLDLTDEASSTEYRQLFDTPVRVFTAPMATGAQLCDYMFQDEKTVEVTERIQELLDMTVSPESLEMTCEHPARENDWVTASHSEHSLSTFNSTTKCVDEQSNSKAAVFIGLAVSGCVAAAAAVVSYFFTNSAS